MDDRDMIDELEEMVEEKKLLEGLLPTKKDDFSDYEGMPYQFDNMTGSMNL